MNWLNYGKILCAVGDHGRNAMVRECLERTIIIMTNFVNTLLLGFFVVFSLHYSSFAQSKEVSYSDVFRKEQAALQLIRSIPHRSIMTSWVYPERGERVIFKSVLTRETIGPDRLHSIQENVVSEPGSFKRMEFISIAGRNYRRFDEGPWQVLGPSPDYIGPANGPPAAQTVSRPRFENSAQVVETLTEKGRLVSVYETKSRITKEVDGKEVSQITTFRFWFRDDGMLLRKDGELETIGEARILKNSTVYEYDDIKIEAPINNQ